MKKVLILFMILFLLTGCASYIDASGTVYICGNKYMMDELLGCDFDIICEQ